MKNPCYRANKMWRMLYYIYIATKLFLYISCASDIIKRISHFNHFALTFHSIFPWKNKEWKKNQGIWNDMLTIAQKLHLSLDDIFLVFFPSRKFLFKYVCRCCFILCFAIYSTRRIFCMHLQPLFSLIALQFLSWHSLKSYFLFSSHFTFSLKKIYIFTRL